MYLEPSALVGILLEEPDRDQLLAKLVQAERPVMSVVGQVEAALSFGKSIGDYAVAGGIVAETIDRLGVEVAAVPSDIFGDVITCYARYGRGTGHGAKLNFGDCFSYVMAKRLANGLILFKGGDFSKTDLTPA
ncbi:Ribonuclease VapC42 [Aquamicrobium terrae]